MHRTQRRPSQVVHLNAADRRAVSRRRGTWSQPARRAADEPSGRDEHAGIIATLASLTRSRPVGDVSRTGFDGDWVCTSTQRRYCCGSVVNSGRSLACERARCAPSRARAAARRSPAASSLRPACSYVWAFASASAALASSASAARIRIDARCSTFSRAFPRVELVATSAYRRPMMHLKRRRARSASCASFLNNVPVDSSARRGLT